MKKEVKPLPHIDIVLTIYNQEKLIERVLYGIFKHTTTPFTLIVVFDGCTDRTKPRVLEYVEKYRPPYLQEVRQTDSSNVFETRANNIGYKMVQSDYFITLQDDMVIQETGWERRLTYPLRMRDDVLGVTARIAQDIDRMDDTHQEYKNRMAQEYGTLPRNIFAIRDIINRGPIAWKTEYIRKLNYLNEAYAPAYLDEADLCLRAWTEHKWKVGSFSIKYVSRTEWGKTRAKDSGMKMSESAHRNQARLGRDHREYIDSGVKHDEEVRISESEIDYVENPHLPLYFHYPVRYDRNHLLQLIKQKIKGLMHRLGL